MPPLSHWAGVSSSAHFGHPSKVLDGRPSLHNPGRHARSRAMPRRPKTVGDRRRRIPRKAGLDQGPSRGSGRRQIGDRSVLQRDSTSPELRADRRIVTEPEVRIDYFADSPGCRRRPPPGMPMTKPPCHARDALTIMTSGTHEAGPKPVGRTHQDRLLSMKLDRVCRAAVRDIRSSVVSRFSCPSRRRARRSPVREQCIGGCQKHRRILFPYPAAHHHQTTGLEETTGRDGDEKRSRSIPFPPTKVNLGPAWVRIGRGVAGGRRVLSA